MTSETQLSTTLEKPKSRKGRPKGGKNRSTIVREILAMKYCPPEEILDGILTRYPALKNSLTLEEVMTIVQAEKAIQKTDTPAYLAVMDSAYGKPREVITQIVQQANREVDISALSKEDQEQFIHLYNKLHIKNADRRKALNLATESEGRSDAE